MSLIYGVVGIAIALGSFYLSALGISIIFDVELIYGFIIPLLVALLFVFIPISGILRPIMSMILLIAPIVGLISLFQ